MEAYCILIAIGVGLSPFLFPIYVYCLSLWSLILLKQHSACKVEVL